MFAATLTLTIAGVARTLIRQNQDNFGSQYQYSDAVESITMKIRHSRDNADAKNGIVMLRHNVFVEHVVYPTPTALRKQFTSTTTIRQGEYDSPTSAADLVKAVHVLLAASSSAMITGLTVGEN